VPAASRDVPEIDFDPAGIGVEPLNSWPGVSGLKLSRATSFVNQKVRHEGPTYPAHAAGRMARLKIKTSSSASPLTLDSNTVCGIAGAFAFGPGSDPIDQALILRLNDLQQRRGPDGSGLWSSEHNRVVLGHRRLAIIDTGASGRQPMSDVTGRWVISFNGEIYNYRALRLELERLGCVFHTNSDTEVLINAVAQWGEAGLRKLRGMFAFALWDALKQELWLARDPYGIKPLYVAESHGILWFASQARSLASCAPIDTRRDAAALTGFYLWGHVPEPFSWWAGIRMLPPGHVQRIRAGHAPSAPKAFARVEEAYLSRPARPLAHGELRQLLLDSVRDHMVSDVPVGVFLSAGIDSNVIAALACRAWYAAAYGDAGLR
jgi:asparagine synthase (glutamine-hydrolysing)